MARGSNRAKIEEWTSRLKRFKESNQTVAAFCRNDGVSVPSFYHWKKKLRDETTWKPFQAVRVASPLAVPIREETVIQLGGGILIRLGSDLSVVAVVVKQLLATVIDAQAAGTQSSGVESC